MPSTAAKPLPGVVPIAPAHLQSAARMVGGNNRPCGRGETMTDELRFFYGSRLVLTPAGLCQISMELETNGGIRTVTDSA